MKREFLQNIKVGDAALPKEIIDLIMEENGKDIEAVKAKFADYDSIKEHLVEANKQIEGFKGMDIDGVRKAAEEWKQKAEQAENDAAQKIADMQFESSLKEAIAAAKGKSSKAIAALLDVDTLKQSKNQTEDIKKALESLKKDNDYLFDGEPTPPPYAPGAGSQNMGRSYTNEQLSKMSFAEYKAARNPGKGE